MWCASPTTTPCAVPNSCRCSLDARVVVGEEMKTHAGEIIGLFLTDRVPQGLAPGDGRARP